MKRILVVDDDNNSRKLVCDLLELYGYEVIMAIDGKQGVDLARSNKPDLILMDIQLPVMNGWEATKLLKNDPLTEKLIIVALTASAMPGDHERTLQAGCDGYLTKPIEIHEFRRDIEKYLAQTDEQRGQRK